MRVRQYRRQLGSPKTVVYNSSGKVVAVAEKGVPVGVVEYREKYWVWAAEITLCKYSLSVDREGGFLLKVIL